jgi:hypothetical protein
MVLRVRPATAAEVYHDIARIPEVFRQDRHGRTIPEATLCEVRSAFGSAFLFVRGYHGKSEPIIVIDERTRNLLKLDVDQYAEFEFDPCDGCGELRWAWNASEPAYRISVRLAILSVVLGIIAIGIALLPLLAR